MKAHQEIVSYAQHLRCVMHVSQIMHSIAVRHGFIAAEDRMITESWSKQSC